MTDNKRSQVANKSLAFSLLILKLLKNDSLTRPYVLSDQLMRSATSIGANIFEARSASSRRDFIRFYEIALKSGNETLYWLKLFEYYHGISVSELLEQAQELCRILAKSILTMKGKSSY